MLRPELIVLFNLRDVVVRMLVGPLKPLVECHNAELGVLHGIIPYFPGLVFKQIIGQLS